MIKEVIHGTFLASNPAYKIIIIVMAVITAITSLDYWENPMTDKCR